MTNTTLLSWINTEVERALGVVHESLGKLSAGAPDAAAALGTCPVHLHQVSGALRMVGLGGATAVCEAIEAGFAALGQRPAPAAVAAVDRAVLALKEFVADLARGQADRPMRLLPMYREVAGIAGRADASEKDLFYPDLSIVAPPHRRPKLLPKATIEAFVKKQRALFQRGLLGWLRNNPAGLEDMRRAVNQLHKIGAQLPAPQAIWWVANGMLDALAGSESPEWVTAAKALGTRVERQMSSGVPAANDSLLRELLYAVAKCRTVSPRIQQIRDLYRLDNLFAASATPGAALELDAERLEVSLYDLHSRLDALKRAWVQYVSGEDKSAARIRELLGAFRTRARDLGSQHLLKLLDVINMSAIRLPDPYPRNSQAMVLEMASAFLLVEHVVDTFSNPADDLEQQIQIMGGWLLDAVAGKSNGEPPKGLRADLTERIGVLQLRAHVAREIFTNLQHVEQVLDAFARNPEKRATLASLQPLVRQIDGALIVLGMTRAAEAVTICEKLIQRCATDAEPKAVAEHMDWIAEGLSSIGFFLEPCRHGRDPAGEAVELFFRRYEKRDAPLSLDSTMRLKSPVATASVVPGPRPLEGASPVEKKPSARPGVDPELLEVFLEEAGEVLAAIEASSVEWRARPDDREALAVIRRGFHTLKGSGRMVGLMDMGEAAWEVEQVLNRWMEEKREANEPVLLLVSTAATSYSGWIARLREGTLEAEVDAAAILDLAARAKSDGKPPQPEEVTIGGLTLARAFFDIYIKEALGHAGVLEADFAAWQPAAEGESSHEFMRAAHTLASSSRTAGFIDVAELAAAVEDWTPHAARSHGADDAAVVQRAIARLRAMVDGIARREAPAAAPDEIAALSALCARLAAPAPGAEISIPQDAAPEPVPAQPSGREKRVMRDDIDEQLLPIFLEEAQEIVPNIGSDLRDWKANPTDEKVHESLRRLLHTLKGSARMAGAIRLGELCHLMETRIEEALEANQVPADMFEYLQERMDRISSDVERMGVPAVPEEAPKPAAPVVVAQKPKPVQPKVEAPLPRPAAMLRMNAETLDHLINEAGEVAIARSRIEAELRSVKQQLTELNESIARLRGQLREVEVQADSQMQSRLSEMEERNRDFDPLEFDRYTRLQELTRLMAEGLNDVNSIQQAVAKSIGDSDGALAQQARITRDVQQELMRVRAVPFSNLSERLHRVVRQTARELGKKAELEIEGASVELDRSVLERIGAPLEHMLRNALAHGIESPEARAAAGKGETGTVSISLRQESNEIALTLSDDGAGLDLERLRQKGLERGLLPAGRQVTDAELAQLIFHSGLSTAQEVSELAGRGVGMDVVRAEISAIGGRVDILTTRGQGATFTVYLPLTLAVTQAVLVRSGGALIAISSAMVEQVLRLKSDALAQLYDKRTVVFQDRSYALHYVQHLLGLDSAVDVKPYNSVLLLRSGVQRVALHVDEMAGNLEIVVKSIGPQLSRVPGVVGATVLADGAIAPIMNPVALAQRLRTAAPVPQPTAPAASDAKPAAPLVMVVDDSLTVRKITSRLLEREGYQVITAKDGVDALERMKDALPAVMLVDIEMPRMDGFDLTRNVRADARMQGVPIIFISSRTAEKHRNQAATVGANEFLGKPYQEAELLQHVARFVGDRPVRPDVTLYPS